MNIIELGSGWLVGWLVSLLLATGLIRGYWWFVEVVFRRISSRDAKAAF